MKFKDMKLGDRFECWGDIDLGSYEYPKICLMEKRDEISATEIMESGEFGESVLMSKDSEFEVLATSNPDALKTYRQTKGEWVTIPETPEKKKVEPVEPEKKPRPGMSAFYAGMYPELAEVARKHGYALAVHGSLRKDFDLFAIPWIENPSEPKVFLEDLTKEFALRIAGEPDIVLGRERWTLHFTFGDAWLDIQFMVRS